jgi:hypothetical protein
LNTFDYTCINLVFLDNPNDQLKRKGTQTSANSNVKKSRLPPMTGDKSRTARPASRDKDFKVSSNKLRLPPKDGTADTKGLDLAVQGENI